MGRWEPNARGRLERAAWELFRERGYTRTTVEEIAARAGLTERTFFRYFADKREVLFWGAGALQKLMEDAIAAAAPGTAPLEAVALALEAAASILGQRRDIVRDRQKLIAAHAELQERESIKLRTLAAAVTEALGKRGVAQPAASLAAEAGMAVFRVGFERWLDDPRARNFSHHIRASIEELKAVTAASANLEVAPARVARRSLSRRKPRWTAGRERS